jgi:hypothetical protein
VRVTLEGPAEFELVSDLEARCNYGKFRADVSPPGNGFKVLAPNMQVTDRGTAFGMNVCTNGNSEVYVFKGKVDMSSAAQPQQQLLAGQAVRVDSQGQVNQIRSNQVSLVSPEEMKHLWQQARKERYAGWQTYSRRLAQDPSLLLYYDFESKSPDGLTLLNRAPGADPVSNGTIVGCEWTSGRWSQKNALEIKQFGDRIRFRLSTNLESMTCMTWIRVDGLDHQLNALMMAADAKAGEPQWQLLQPGCLQFCKRKTDGWGLGKVESYMSQPLLDPTQMGLWVQLAVVYDGQNHQVTHYLNGKAVWARPTDSDFPLRLGAMEVGNWTPHVGEPMERIRNFNGRIDEFAIWSRALSAEEIGQAFQAGCPF